MSASERAVAAAAPITLRQAEHMPETRMRTTQTNQGEGVMRQISNGIAMGVAVALLAGAAGAAGPPGGPLSRCAADAVVSGAGCMDKYEASVWRGPNPTTVNKFFVGRIRR